MFKNTDPFFIEQRFFGRWLLWE